MKKLPLIALFVTAALVPCLLQADTNSQPEAFSGTYLATTAAQFDGVAVYGSTNNGNFTSLTLPVFSTVPINTLTNLGPVTVQVPIGATNLRVAVFSVYGSMTSSAVALTLDPTYAASIVAAGGTAFGTAFGGTNETTIAADIQAAAGGSSTASTALESFFNTYSADFPAVNSANSATGTVVTFSNAAVGGNATLNLAPAPEPSTWALLGAGMVGAGVVAMRHRRARA